MVSRTAFRACSDATLLIPVFSATEATKSDFLKVSAVAFLAAALRLTLLLAGRCRVGITLPLNAVDEAATRASKRRTKRDILKVKKLSC